MNRRTTIGLFGGTFDPIHLGHLRVALELKQRLALDQMRMLPCHIPPHRQEPRASASDRLAMVQVAIGQCSQLQVDELELQNAKPSFSVHTLEILRDQLGSEVSLCLAIGMDSLASLNTWYRWRELLELAHIVVAARPGWQEPSGGEMADYIGLHRGVAANLAKQSRGKIVIEELSLLPISSTEIRRIIGSGESAQFLVPDCIWSYIQDHQLYG